MRDGKYEKIGRSWSDKKEGDKKEGDKKEGDKKEGDKKEGDKKEGDKKDEKDKEKVTFFSSGEERNLDKSVKRAVPATATVSVAWKNSDVSGGGSKASG